MNQVFLVGRLTKKPTLRYSTNETAIAKFNLAIDKPLSKAKQKEFEAKDKPTADFPRITTWGQQAENCSTYLDKGSLVAVHGHINTHTYENDDGNTIYTTEIHANYVKFLSSKNNNSPFDAMDDDLPFK
jgi:single-strand DNA-binding protein